MSLPDAVKLTANGADPEAIELANATHVGALLAAVTVGVAIAGVGDGAVAMVGVTAPLGAAVGEVLDGVGEVRSPVQDFARIEICNGDDPAEL